MLATNRCPFCHEDVRVKETNWVSCRSCQARHHQACWAESGQCASCRDTCCLSLAPSLGPPRTTGPGPFPSGEAELPASPGRDPRVQGPPSPPRHSAVVQHNEEWVSRQIAARSAGRPASSVLLPGALEQTTRLLPRLAVAQAYWTAIAAEACQRYGEVNHAGLAQEATEATAALIECGSTIAYERLYSVKSSIQRVLAAPVLHGPQRDMLTAVVAVADSAMFARVPAENTWWDLLEGGSQPELLPESSPSPELDEWEALVRTLLRRSHTPLSLEDRQHVEQLAWVVATAMSSRATAVLAPGEAVPAIRLALMWRVLERLKWLGSDLRSCLHQERSRLSHALRTAVRTGSLGGYLAARTAARWRGPDEMPLVSSSGGPRLTS